MWICQIALPGGGEWLRLHLGYDGGYNGISLHLVVLDLNNRDNQAFEQLGMFLTPVLNASKAEQNGNDKQ